MTGGNELETWRRLSLGGDLWQISSGQMFHAALNYLELELLLFLFCVLCDFEIRLVLHLGRLLVGVEVCPDARFVLRSPDKLVMSSLCPRAYCRQGHFALLPDHGDDVAALTIAADRSSFAGYG